MSLLSVLRYTVIASVLMLSGCHNSDLDDHWLQYQQQLSDALGISSIETTLPDNIDAFPDTQRLIFDIEEIRTGMLNVYALRECQITSLVAARNNQLGKVAPPSQQWLYERELWQHLSGCWNTQTPEQLSQESRQQLLDLTMTKTAQLPYVSWNALFESTEWQNNFSRASSPLYGTTRQDLDDAFAALSYLKRMTLHQFDRQWEQDSSMLESHLKALRERPLTAEILRALLLASHRLDEATQLLQQTPSTNCLPAWKTTELQHLSSIAKQWLESVNELVNSHPITPPDAWQHYRHQWLSLTTTDAPWHKFKTSLARHQTTRDNFSLCAS
ncbi:DUF3080 family protein [Vreelandella aquamarina]